MEILDINEVDVFYNNKKVGFLCQNADNSTSFYYEKDWLKNGFSISPFKLPLELKEFRCNDYLCHYLFGVFYDSLPDSWGNYLMDKYLISCGINPTRITLLQRLALLDKYSLGGLTYRPSFKDTFSLEKINEFDNLKQKIDSFIKNDCSIDLDLYHKGSSTGGSRPKVNTIIDNEIYIVKFPSMTDSQDSGYKEYKINELAKKCKLNVTEFKLVNSNQTKGYFATKRFDRDGTKRKHVISLAGLFDLDERLSQIHYLGFLQVTRKLCPQDLNQALKLMIFNYLIDNKDDHPRNISYIYDEKNKQYRLAPFFDLTSTPNISGHMMLVNNKDKPTIDDFIVEASKVGIKKEVVITIYEELKKEISNFKL